MTTQGGDENLREVVPVGALLARGTRWQVAQLRFLAGVRVT